MLVLIFGTVGGLILMFLGNQLLIPGLWSCLEYLGVAPARARAVGAQLKLCMIPLLIGLLAVYHQQDMLAVAVWTGYGFWSLLYFAVRGLLWPHLVRRQKLGAWLLPAVSLFGIGILGAWAYTPSRNPVMLRTGAGILLLFLTAAVFFLSSRKGERRRRSGRIAEKRLHPWPALLALTGGMAALMLGGHLFLEMLTDLSLQLSVSLEGIGSVIAALCTLPVLFHLLCRKPEQPSLAGSELHSLLLRNAAVVQLGAACASLVFGVSVWRSSETLLLMLAVGSLVMSLIVWLRGGLGRLEGILFLLMEFTYFIYLSYL